MKPWNPSLLLLAAASAPIARGQIAEFAAPWAGYETSVYPSSIESWGLRQADFDGDGKLDLAVSGWYANPRLSILPGDGEGRFAAPDLYVLPLGARDLEVADFDRDGDIDIAVSGTGQHWEGTFLVRFDNVGRGQFAQAGFIAAGQGPTDLTTADFNGDGWPDLAVAHDESIDFANSFAVILNDGAGGFLPPSIVTTPSSGTHAIDSGDVDGDGEPDLVLALETNRIVVSLNQGGTFGPGVTLLGAPAQPITEEPCAEIADVDGDGDRDVLYSNIGSGSHLNGTLALFENTGGGALAPAQPIPLGSLSQGAVDLALGDVTGDGAADILAALEGAQKWCLLPGDGQGGFLAARQYLAGEDPIAIEPSDLDQDGDLDVVALGRGSLEVCVHLNAGAGEFPVPQVLEMSEPALAPSSYSDLVSGDLDLDGDLDLAVAWRENFGSQLGISVRRNDGAGDFGPRESYPVPVLPLAMELGDLNGDGALDLAWLDGGFDPRLRWKLNAGNGTFGPTQTYATALCGHGGDLELGDANGDGRLDLLAVECNFDVYIGLNTGSGFAPPLVHSIGDVVRVLESADLNGDGRLDLVTNSGPQGFVEVSLGNGDGTFGAPLWFQGGRDVTAIAARDVDDDGILDLCTAYDLDGNGLSVLIGRGDGTFKPGVQYPGSYSSTWDNLRSIALADVDQDRDLDVAIANFGSQDVSYWSNRGDGTFEPEVRVGVSNQAWDVELGDYTGDGAIDLAVQVAPVAPNSWYYLAVTLIEGRIGPGWAIYCTAKLSSQGCVPSLTASGSASATATSGFVVGATEVLNNKSGLLVYGLNGPANLPFQGGRLCVQPPLQRALAMNSGGNPPPDDCSGSFSIDLNAFAHGLLGGNPNPALLVPGTQVHCQWWSRDPGFAQPANSSLSDALAYVVGL